MQSPADSPDVASLTSATLSPGDAQQLPPPLRQLSSYQVLGRLGDGGMGVVYRALDAERGEVVALKTLRRMNDASFERLKAEFRAVADVVHPNLVALHELLIEDDIPYFTMELVEGTDFLSYVRGTPVDGTSSHELDEAGIARLRHALGQLAVGVNALHLAGKVHRDLKRNNVMVTPEGRVVLLDFGLAVDQLAGEETAALVGTPAYMAPEQLRGQKVSGAADWFAVGVMLYRALTGTVPAGNTPADRMSTQGLLPPRPSILAGAVPEDLDALCMDLLQPDPTLRPTDAEVLDRLGVAATAVPGPNRDNAPLVGRSRELEALDEALAVALDGSATVVHVHGQSGVGKSALIRRWLDGVAEGGAARVHRSRCRERESFSYKAFDGLIDGVARDLAELPTHDLFRLLPPGMAELARLFPALRAWTGRPSITAPVDAQTQRRRAFHCLKTLLSRLAERTPLVLWIDDLQWIDADSVRMLRELLAPPAPEPLLLLCTSRQERNVTARQLPWQPGAGAIDLPIEPLSEGQSLALARALVSPAAADTVAVEQLERIAHESLGNPFIIEQMVRYAEAGGASDALSLDAVVLARRAQLPPDASRLLDVVAVAGHPLPQAVAIDVAEPEGDAWAALSLLRSGNLIQTHGTRGADMVETWHDRVRESVAGQLGDSARVRYHGAIAAALEASAGVDPAQLATHFRAGQQNDKASRYAVRAAEQAEAALAFDRAAELYQLAIDCGATDRDVLLRARADALVHGGRCAEAAPLYREAASRASGSGALELRRLAAEQLMVSGRLDEGVEQLRPVLAALDLRYPRSTAHALASVLWQLGKLKLRGFDFVEREETAIPEKLLRQVDLCWSAVKGLLSFDAINAAHFLFAMMDHALRAGERHRVARALMVYGMVTVFDGSPKSHREGSHIIGLGEQVAPEGDRYLEGLSSICRGTAQMSIGDWRTGLAGLEAGIAILERHCASVRWECAAARSSTFNTLFWLGDIAEIARRAPTWQRDGERVGDLFAIVTAELYGAYAKLANDDPGGARAATSSAMKKWSQRGFHYQHWLAEKIGVWCDLYEGNVGAAKRRLEACLPQLKRSGLLRVQLMELDALLFRGRLAVAGSPSRRALKRVLALARSLDRMGRPAAEAGAALLRAQVAAARGERSLGGLRSAAELFEGAEIRTYALATRRRAALLAGDDGEVEVIDGQLRASGVAMPSRWAPLYA